MIKTHKITSMNYFIKNNNLNISHYFKLYFKYHIDAINIIYAISL